MAIYNFKAQFADAVRSGAKTQTIRARGKRQPPKAGDWAYCYTGLRTSKVCRLGAFRIIYVMPITISSGSRSVSVPGNGGKGWCSLNNEQIEQLALADGFPSSDEFFKFFEDNYGGTMGGHVINWDPKESQ